MCTRLVNLTMGASLPVTVLESERRIPARVLPRVNSFLDRQPVLTVSTPAAVKLEGQGRRLEFKVKQGNRR